MRLALVLFALALTALRAQTPLAAPTPAPPQGPCANTPAYSPCELTFDLSEQDAAAYPTPYTSVELKVEFRSPRFHTYLMPGFWNGGRRMVVRFAPTEAGEWVYRVTSNIAAWEGQHGTFTAADSQAPGFIRTANVHHWAYTERNLPHLWMGDTELRFAFIDDAAFRSIVDARAAQKFNHIRGLVLGGAQDTVYTSPDTPNLAQFERLDQRVQYMNQKGITADLILAGAQGQLTRLFPTRQQRQRYLQYIVARYAALNVTWEGVEYFEDYPNGRALLKEMGTALKDLDPYQHPRTTGARITSAPLLDDGWMNFVSYSTADDNVGAVEHQLYAVPFVNLDFGHEDSGAGKSGANDIPTDEFRRRLWRATMDGESVTFANTGTDGSRAVDARYADSAGAKQMTVWFNFLSDTRYWELEPYFDVDGGRAVALEDAEYVVYVEKPGPVELLVEKHGYDVYWLNPITGETIKQKFKGDHFTGEPPDKSHDWVLHVVREGHVESMNKSYKFESREILMQEIEQNSPRVPFQIVQPAGDLSAGKPATFEAKITRENRSTRTMMWLWIGEVAAEGQGYRVLSTGQKGTGEVPAGMAKNFPAVMNLRLYGMNANGKVYALDRPFQFEAVKSLVPNPLILAVDTTHEFGSIALQRGEEAIEEVELHEPSGFAHVLYVHLEQMLERHNIRLSQVDCFAAASGPGSFTGVRVGLACIKGMAEAFGKPAVAVSNLRALAAFGSAPMRAVILDARRGEVYGAVYDAAGRAVLPETVGPLAAWLATVPAGEVEWISPDFTAFNAEFAEPRFEQGRKTTAPRALAGKIACIALGQYRRGEACDPAALDANYVRRSDAELFWKE
ncbi:MAG TPA: tRNA (adenosine(37)-N6)-threonylcarbamoyltransferase complex dimerization subunit type 1 TsaB [Bryobacteraceae bacterium]|nr:tRNA (adenosine(37)-N6)-threonylcarbamoyltransferase complex dimerization subunit type 1 TsaB [Bryobacteraceae bacterium]